MPQDVEQTMTLLSNSLDWATVKFLATLMCKGQHNRALISLMHTAENKAMIVEAIEHHKDGSCTLHLAHY